jgi:DNA repair exonuclease SbcCD ATPase subunit
MIPRSAPASPYLPSMSGHLHIDGETCPWCEQDIPPEKLEEIRGRIAAKEHERARAIATKLEQQYEMDKAQYDARAKVELELERQRSP